MAGTFSGYTTTTYTLTVKPTTVTSTGTINATTASVGILGTTGIAWTVANIGTVRTNGNLAGRGIYLQSGGSVTNGASGSAAGLISANLDGVAINGAGGTVINYGSISADGLIPTTFVGAGVIMFKVGSVANFGTISGTGTTDTGVNLQSGGTITNGQSGSAAGLIAGYQNGVFITGGTGGVTNYGTISAFGTHGTGVNLRAGGKLTNSGSISSTTVGTYGNGVYVAGAAGSITNNGSISASGIKGVGVHFNAGGELTNFGAISAFGSGGTGVLLNAGGTVTNLGTIQKTGTAGLAVKLQQGGVVINGASNSTGALIEGGNGPGADIAGSAGAVVNFGTVDTTLSANGAAVFLEVGGLVTNYGMITASNSISTPGTPGIAVVLVHGAAESGTVVNFGTISAAPTNAHGLNLDTGGILINGTAGLTTALITSAYNAVYIGGTFGTPSSGHLGFVFNYGTIQNTSSAQAAVQLVSGGSVTNRGLISSARTGISFNNTAGTIDNFASIVSTAPLAGTRGAGVYLGAGGLITNEAGASITALRPAVSLTFFGTTSAAAMVINSGTLTGSVGVSIGAADTGKNTVVNSGRIAGAGGTAVQFGAGNDTLIVKPGAVFSGAVRGGGGTDTIIQSAAGTLKVTGFSGFETIRLANGAAESLALKNANFTGVTGGSITVEGGNAGNTVNASALTGANRVIAVGGAGTDHFTGGAGSDIFKFSVTNLKGSDTVVGGAGNDKLMMTTAGTIKAGGINGVETLQLAGGLANSLTLTSANFTGVGGHTVTVFDGNSGNIVNAATLPATDRVVVHAGAGADTMKGGAGNDLLYAAVHSTMTGRAGTNLFTFAHIGTNRVTDFGASSTNKIVLRKSGFNLGADESLATGTPQHLLAGVFVANSTGAFTNTSQRFAYNTTTGALRYSADGSGPAASGAVVVLTGHPGLSAGSTGNLFFTS